jgi:Reverse transcriptase (RNA-dependent DNA polymerase)
VRDHRLYKSTTYKDRHRCVNKTGRNTDGENGDEQEGFVFLSNEVSYTESMSIDKSPQYEKWKVAMDKEVTMLNIRNTFDIVKREDIMVVISTRWVFVVKLSPAGDRYKARFEVRGCNQVPGRDFSDTFSPTLNKDSFRILMVMGCSRDMHMIQMDVKCAFL